MFDGASVTNLQGWVQHVHTTGAPWTGEHWHPTSDAATIVRRALRLRDALKGGSLLGEREKMWIAFAEEQARALGLDHDGNPRPAGDAL
jgi:hypothetical protein